MHTRGAPMHTRGAPGVGAPLEQQVGERDKRGASCDLEASKSVPPDGRAGRAQCRQTTSRSACAPFVTLLRSLEQHVDKCEKHAAGDDSGQHERVLVLFAPNGIQHTARCGGVERLTVKLDTRGHACVSTLRADVWRNRGFGFTQDSTLAVGYARQPDPPGSSDTKVRVRANDTKVRVRVSDTKVRVSDTKVTVRARGTGNDPTLGTPVLDMASSGGRGV
eukprot:355178-Chlamydomonas_euryale.AAC.2